jgi:hypothetical protein
MKTEIVMEEKTQYCKNGEKIFISPRDGERKCRKKPFDKNILTEHKIKKLYDIFI